MNKISKRVTSLNLGIMALLLTAVIIASVVAINKIADTASAQLAHLHALESLGNFKTHVSGDLALLNRAANTQAVREWFADEYNEEKRKAAFQELVASAALLQSRGFYFGIVDSQNEYSMDVDTPIEDLTFFAKMSRDEPMDAWFFDLLDSDQEFLFNIDVDKINHRWTVWINHKVVYDGRVVGVICTSVEIGDILHTMFGEYGEQHIRGYVIDNAGFIHIGGTLYEHLSHLKDDLTHIGSYDTALGMFVEDFVSRHSRFFTSDYLPGIVRLSGGAYSYAAVTPIANSDWMVVILFDSDALFHADSMVLLVAALIFGLVLYMVITVYVTRRYVLNPLTGLTESISQVKADDVENSEIYGASRKDEIGDLSRTIQCMLDKIKIAQEKERKAREAIVYRDKLLSTVNRAAETLLIASENDLMQALLGGMKIVGQSLDVDRVQIWRIEKVDGMPCAVLRYAWLSEVGEEKKAFPIGFTYTYSDHAGWLDVVLCGGNVNESASSASPHTQALFADTDTLSIAILPLALDHEIIGFFCAQCCLREHTFSKDEMDILASAGLMFASVFYQNVQRELAYSDALTGAHNRRFLMEMGERELQSCLSKNQDFSLIMADIDFFKKINDQYGHTVGDEVLKVFTARIRHVLKEGTMLVRYGGEEFAIALPGVGYKSALKAGWRMKSHIEDSAFVVGDVEIKVTASFGVATGAAHNATLPEIIDNADKALYEAKKTGRNTVVGFDDKNA